MAGDPETVTSLVVVLLTSNPTYCETCVNPFVRPEKCILIASKGNNSIESIPTPTPSPPVPGFEAVFAILTIAAVTYLLRRRR
ncbi:MAG: PGF-CTERM sorting domain-containing protein [Methanocellales archaeon]|nr:PGF-CTERM sorting domain-containing protein [Methanocellales archaeon]